MNMRVLYSKWYLQTNFVNAMYDTTKLFLSREQAGGPILDCLPFLTNLSETYKQESAQAYITGHSGNLRVCISEYGVSIIGSLPKFYLGTNLHTLTRSDSRRAFEKMADTLHLPINKASVRRVDVGLNIITQYKPELYFSYLGQSNYYKRLTQPKSISYQNTLRSKKFYNKIAESQSKGIPIPEAFQGKNLLRYELSYMQRLPKQFNHAIITPNTLTNKFFYMNLIDRLVKEYEAIQKIGLVNMDTSRIKSPKDYFKQLIALAIQEKGLDTFLQHVDLLKEQNTFDKPEYYSRLRSEMKKLSSCPTNADTSELIQELNKKIKMAKKNYR
jgi:hypothetical protein